MGILRIGWGGIRRFCKFCSSSWGRGWNVFLFVCDFIYVLSCCGGLGVRGGLV